MIEGFSFFNKRTYENKVSRRLQFEDSLKTQRGEAVFFTDPLTKKDIPQNKPPDFLLQDKRLRDGFDFLHKNGKKINIKLHLAPHNPDKPEFLGDVQFERDVRGYDVVLLEGMGWGERLQATLEALSRGDSANVDMETLKEYAGPGDTYHLRLVEALNGCGAALGFYDVEGTEDAASIQGQILDNGQILDGLLEKSETEEVRQDPQLALTNMMAINLNVVALEALREWYMVCGIGLQLKRITSNIPEKADRFRKGELRVLVIAGHTHQDLFRKLESHVEVSADIVRTEGKENPVNAAIPRWLAQGYVDLAELQKLSAEEIQ